MESMAARPEDVPEKFWDAGTGEIRVAPLLQSYRALERKLSERPDRETQPGVESELESVALEHVESSTGLALNGVVENADSAQDYDIAVEHGLFESDARVNQRLWEAGFSPKQAQLVYDLAAEELMPVTEEIAGALRMEIDDRRLETEFGGAETWREMRHQLKSWGQSNLPTDAYESLASSYEGVQALHRLMKGSEPRVIQSGAAENGVTEAGLRRMIADPRYWRDRDPALVRDVTQGFQRLYPNAD
ncbi:MAG: hypothetical protein HOI19_02200 [Rhodospirillaceae bacterium]|jgi:hypothetical protein|nr:hypothetical protein [Rhodospirillaceae bacterium]